MGVWNYCSNYRRCLYNKSTQYKFRRHLPGELQAASEKVTYRTGTDMLEEFFDVLNEYGGPPIVYIGASHVNHLKRYMDTEGHHDKYYAAFSNAHYVGIGGSTWTGFKKNIFGEELPSSQEFRGDQWTPFRDRMGKIAYICITLGSNDADQFQNWILEQHRKSGLKKLYWRVVDAEMRIRFQKIKDKVDELLDFLMDEMPNAQLCMSTFSHVAGGVPTHESLPDGSISTSMLLSDAGIGSRKFGFVRCLSHTISSMNVSCLACSELIWCT